MGILNRFTRRKQGLGHEELKQAYRSAFSSQAGQSVLDDLCSVLKQAQWPDKDCPNMPDARAFRDGQRSMALRVLAMLEE